MQQYFAKNKNLELEDSDYHHIKNVMKMKRGDLIKVVFDDTIYTCKLNNINDVSFDIVNNIKPDYRVSRQIDVGEKYIPISDSYKDHVQNYLSAHMLQGRGGSV